MRARATWLPAVALGLACGGVTDPSAVAQPADKPQSARAQARYPQPVQVGTLAGRRVIEPEESQHVLGRVRGVVRDGGGANRLVLDVGGWLAPFGVGSRLVTVAADDLALLGEYVVLADVDPDDLRKLPSYRPGTLPDVPPGQTILMGVVKPFH